MKRLISLAILIESIGVLHAQTPCENGMAGDYPCQNVTMLGHLSTEDLLAEQDGGVYLNDIWGWTDPDTDKEYAIVGLVNGTSFVDITDPTIPIMLGILPEHNVAESAKPNSSSAKRGGANSIWRDIKVYQNHAYIVSEDNTHGMQVFDLTNLRGLGTPDEPLTFSETAHYDGIGDAHNIVINEETGFAYVVGATGAATCGAGGLHIVNIQDPANPVYEACFDNDGYTHDGQCVIYNGPDEKYAGKEICFGANEETVTIVDVDNKEAMTIISTTAYDGVGYTHQGWLTEDHKYFISNDELDEWEGATDKTKTFIWDVQDLDNPYLMQVYDHSTSSIDHNLYIVGDMMYQSNYVSGLRVFDLSKIESGFIRETGYFDTYPAADGLDWSGSWSNYPFFPSGTIAVSDQTNGLFLLKEEYTSNYVVHEPADFEGCENGQVSIWFEVAGDGLIYQWQYDLGSGFVDVEGDNYSGIDTNQLTIVEGQPDIDGVSFRCIATAGDNEYMSESAVLTLKSKPRPAFEYFALNNKVEFSNTSSDADAYEWDFGDGSSKTTFSEPTHEYPAEDGSYTVVLTAENACGTESTENIVSVIITDADSYERNIIVYPNPVESYISIKTGIDRENLQYAILNTSGQLVLKGNILSNGLQSIDASQLLSGVYLLEIENSLGEKKREKLLIRH